MTLRAAYIHPLLTFAKNLKVLIKVLMIYPMSVVKKNLKVLIKRAMACKVEYWVMKQFLKVLIRLTVG